MKSPVFLSSCSLATIALAMVCVQAEAGPKKVSAYGDAKVTAARGGSAIGVFKQVSQHSGVAELGAQDKLSNFDINRLLSNRNEAESLASSVQKKLDDALRNLSSGEGGARPHLRVKARPPKKMD